MILEEKLIKQASEILINEKNEVSRKTEIKPERKDNYKIEFHFDSTEEKIEFNFSKGSGIAGNDDKEPDDPTPVGIAGY